MAVTSCGGGALLYRQVDAENPFLRCVRSLSSMLVQPPLHGPLKVVFSHWGVDGEDAAWLRAQFCKTVASMVAQIHIRFMVLFSSWPFPLTQVVDQRIAEADRRRVLQTFLGADDCCLDRHFSLKLRSLCSDLEEFLVDEAIMGGIRLWARHTPLANMVTERLLALMKASSPEKTPLVERLVGTSLLTQWLHAHMDASGKDPRRSETRAELARQGVPLAAGAKKRRGKRACARPRGVFSYVKKHRMKRRLSRTARRAETSRLAKRFFALPQAEQEPFVFEEANKVDDVAEDADEKYARLIGDKLFALSSRSDPLREEVFADIVKGVLPGQRGPGMRNYAGLLRAACSARIVVDDAGEIPKRLRLVEVLPCSVAHPGLCPARTPEIYEVGLRFTKNFTNDIKQHGAEGEVYVIKGDGIPDFWCMIGYIRKANPLKVVVLKMEESGGGGEGVVARLRFATAGDEPSLRPLAASEIAAEIFSPGALPHAVDLRRAEVDLTPPTFDVMGLGDARANLIGDGVDAAPVARAPPAEAAAHDDRGDAIAAGLARSVR